MLLESQIPNPSWMWNLMTTRASKILCTFVCLLRLFLLFLTVSRTCPLKDKYVFSMAGWLDLTQSSGPFLGVKTKGR